MGCARPLVFMQCVANPTTAVVAPHIVVAVMIAEGFTIRQLLALIDIFSSIKGLEACERFLIGVIRPKHYHEVVVNGVVGLVARSLLSVCAILPTQRGQGPPTRAQLHIIIFTQVGQLHVEMGEVDADRISLGNSNIPDSLLVIWVDIWEVGGRDPPVHFLQHNAAACSAVKHS